MVSVVNSVKELAVGVVAGIASMLPGISGATVCVAFGVYERLIRDIAYLRKWLTKDIMFLLMLFLGLVIGTILAAKALDFLIDEYPAECMLLFAGLIAGQIPMIYASTGVGRGEKVTVNEWGAFAVGLAVMAVMIVADFLGDSGEVIIDTDAAGCVILFFIGMVVAVSMMLPGLSHSTLLVAMGYFAAFTEIIGDLKIAELAIILIGAVVAVLLFSKILHRALTDHHRVTMFLILGLTVGSIISVLALSAEYLDNTVEILVSAALFVVGLLVSYRFMRNIETDDSSDE